MKSKLRWIKYLVLAASLTIPMVMQSYETFISLWGLALSAGLIVSLVDSHGYCKYFCMNGALFKLAGLLNRRVLVRDREACTSCDLCNQVCLHDCMPGKKDTPINRDSWCTSCFRCKSVCPVNAISYGKQN